MKRSCGHTRDERPVDALWTADDRIARCQDWDQRDVPSWAGPYRHPTHWGHVLARCACGCGATDDLSYSYAPLSRDAEKRPRPHAEPGVPPCTNDWDSCLRPARIVWDGASRRAAAVTTWAMTMAAECTHCGRRSSLSGTRTVTVGIETMRPHAGDR